MVSLSLGNFSRRIASSRRSGAGPASWATITATVSAERRVVADDGVRGGQVEEEEVAPVLVPGDDHVGQGAEGLGGLGVVDVEGGAEEGGLGVEAGAIQDLGEDGGGLGAGRLDEGDVEVRAVEEHQGGLALLVGEAGRAGGGVVLLAAEALVGSDGPEGRRPLAAGEGVDPAGARGHGLEERPGAAAEGRLGGAGAAHGRRLARRRTIWGIAGARGMTATRRREACYVSPAVLPFRPRSFP